MLSKLCPHIQVLDSRTLEAIRRVQPPMVKTMDLSCQALQSIRAAAPGALIVARRYVSSQDFSNPLAAGQSYAEMYRDVLDLVDVVEVYNEAVGNATPADRLALFDTFQGVFAHRIWEMNPRVRVGLFCLPTGNFGYPGEPKLTDFPKTMALPKDKVYICLHEYSWYTWDWESPARCLRYRRLMEGLTGYQVLITECGLTQAVLPGKPDVGWRSGIPRDVFVSGAVWYDNELKKDDYVVGAAMFTCGTSYGWDTFECTAEWEEAVRISEKAKQHDDKEVIKTPIRVLVDGQVRVLELEEYLRAVVPAEMPALWPLEALQAQAVAARSYALWRIANPRTADFDLYGDERDQVFNEARVHPRSDQAVRETKGVYIED